MEDKEIVSLYHMRDERAIRETDAKYGKYCHRIAKNLLTLHEDAEECVNDMYLAAWNRMPPENPHLLSAFLSRIVRNIAISRFRRDRAKKRYDGMEILLSELDDCIPNTENLEKTVEERELSDIISDWLDTLTVDDRALFIRRYYHGESIKELAKISGIPPQALSSRLFTLRAKLKSQLEEKGVSL
jgi:RNA polymerase sigma-70 factor (ECF subfamily)